jgi:uncharacterized small protein (DUF1192 family)
MTDEELIEALTQTRPRNAFYKDDSRELVNPYGKEAADRIEALTAEIERKDAALQAYLDAFDQATGTVYVEPIIRKAMEKQP